ncbi:3-dehydroquinate synthase [Kaistella jeonii]|uniref:3-dehydroquinate synthase n=1 Tax=Kaistella jeonii TaxID=266749 RepID=A0A0C1F529_9FLAO|nr:3-dehydroquinate synthase [Kaistella jeonii]KIA88312.1 3-dehydroquinate synthase [Kaistella jeonii]SFC24095.1 3-dehydroquinate synthase [Kaistella jeonii]VEI94592.1 3-dehydroquinate synthase [Kaistella jeonii]
MISILDQDFSQLNDFLTQLKPTQLLILVDENTHEYCLPTLLENLETEIPFEIIEIEAGEELKTLETATQLWEILTEFETDRKALMINLGGGVITDMGGFIASTYKRGIPFINIPTTLLGMCDASIGGKTGIDHQFLKNIIGTFAHPEAIFVFPEFLNTLPFEELRSGFAEMLKHGLITDEKHWNDLISIQNLTPENVFPFIETSMKIKQNVVEQDFAEQNIRKTLNFGHTIGHALESLFLLKGKPIMHGEAVALGMICETRISMLQDLISEETSDTIISNLRKFFPHINVSAFSGEEILNLMKNDKKNSHGNINFSLLTEIGNSIFNCSVPAENIKNSLLYYQNMP